MRPRGFLDTNVFVYTQSKIEPAKRDIALMALDKYQCCTSTQVFSEISNVMIKKFKMPIVGVKQLLAAINGHCQVNVVTYETVQKALDLKDRYGYSYYDSLIWAAAILSDCDYVFSEDLQDGQRIDDKMEIINIFTRTI